MYLHLVLVSIDNISESMLSENIYDVLLLCTLQISRLSQNDKGKVTIKSPWGRYPYQMFSLVFVNANLRSRETNSDAISLHSHKNTSLCVTEKELATYNIILNI